MILETLPLSVKGHVQIADDLGNVLLDQDNAVHPQNIARVIARSLSNENNFYIHRIAYGNGGTIVNISQQIEYLNPNDGQTPDTSTWDSRLHYETYSEIIDESNVLIGTDPIGGGADPTGDPASVEHTSGPGVRSTELGLVSEVIITSVLNPGEPSGQFDGDGGGGGDEVDPETSFMFDEIGLFTTGLPNVATNGYQDIDVANKVSTDDTGLDELTAYDFDVTVDGGSIQTVTFTTPTFAGNGTGPANTFSFGDLCDAINSGSATWGSPSLVGATLSITEYSGGYTIPVGTQTYGFLRVTSATTGALSTIVIGAGGFGGAADTLLTLETFSGVTVGTSVQAALDGLAAGIQNAPTSPLTERERLLTHIIFSPVLKSANRTLTITYTLTVSVARTV